MDIGSIDWSLWRSFLAVVQEGGLSQAARSLGLAQPTVGRHVAQLEAALGAALFARSRSGMIPTALARRLTPDAERMSATAEALTRIGRSAADEGRGVVRITASEIVGAEVLPEALASYRERWPRVEIELSTTSAQEDLLNRSADIAVRMTRPRQQRLVARKIGVAAGGLYAAQSYVGRRGAPRSVDDLEAHDLIGPDRTRFDAALGERRLDRADLTIRTDSDLAQLAGIRAGLGIGACQHWIARRSGGLLRVLPEIEVFSLDVWLAMHEDLKTDRVIRSVFDHLAVALYANADPQSPSER